MSDIETPLKWLLHELPAYIEPAPLQALMERYHLHKAAYERQVKVRQAERIISVFEGRNNPREAARLARWRTKLAKLKSEGV